MMRTTFISALLIMGLAACGGSSDDADTPSKTAEESPSTAGYVARVNQLCEDMIPDIMAVNGGQYPTRQAYIDAQPKIAEVHEAFDAEVAALEVAEDERDAAEAFTALRAYSDGLGDSLAERAVTMTDEEFTAAWEADGVTFRNSAELSALQSAGIDCPAR